MPSDDLYLKVIYGCKSWTIKKAERRRIDAFKLWFWRRFLTVPWIARRSNQLILKEINPEYSLGGTGAEAEASILWSCHAKSQLTDKRRRGRWRMRWCH